MRSDLPCPVVIICLALVLAAGVSPPTVEAAIPTAQRNALIDVYNSTGGATWNNRLNWRNAGDTDFNDPGTECIWHGVTCDAGQTTVTALSLSANNLVGPIPASIDALPDLELLNLSYNELGGTLPSDLGNLDQLLTLKLEGYDGAISGAIPSELGNMGSIQEITITYHQLSGSIPSTLGSLSTLNTLDLTSNSLSNAIPTALGSLGALTTLNLSYNDLDSGIPTELSSLAALETLNLSGNDLTGSFPINPGGYVSLQTLNLSSNLLSGPLPTGIGGLNKLQYLNLSYNGYAGPIPTGYSSLGNLTHLILDGIEIGGTIPTWLGTLSNLYYLSLRSCQLTGPIPTDLANATLLRYLYLNSNNLTGTIPAFLGILPNLQYLRLNDNQLEGSIPGAVAGSPSLYYLNLSGNQLSGELPSQISNATSLGYLHVSGNHLSGSIPAGFSSLPNLRQLDLGQNKLSGGFPSAICLPSLWWIDLAGNQLVGELPSEVLDMTALSTSSSDLRWNGLWTTSSTIADFLDQKQVDNDWQSTQTVAPSNLHVTSISDHTVWLSWDAVGYLDDPGGYELYFALSGMTDWSSAGWTASKSTTSFPVTNLTADTAYDFVVTTFTEPHAFNFNEVTSAATSTVPAVTLNWGCPQPEIVPVWGSPVVLELDSSYASYLWSTGATSASITVASYDDTWYYVTVSSPDSCSDEAAILVTASIFSDGFESGGATQWSGSTP